MSYPLNFIFATGIECSYPMITGKNGKDKRIDQMEVCGHYKNWKKDFHLALDIGVSHLRYGPPYYKVHLGPDQYDWSFPDETFNYLNEIGLTPITDLCHFGVPNWIGNFQNPDFPYYFAEYAEAFAKRYRWVRWYTPINEILIAASFSALYGWWNERLSDDQCFVTALKNLCKANTLAMRAILKVQPESVFVQSESSEYFHPHSPECMAKANLMNEKRFLALDLTYGHNMDARMYEFLMDNGMTRNEYHWFLDNHVKGFCIMGTDYYSSNEHMVLKDGSVRTTGEVLGYYVITKQYYDRYTIPVMHTETNSLQRELTVEWLRKQWANLFRLRRDGIPIVGFTWYSLTHQKDWDSTLLGDNGTINPCGLYDLDRQIEPVGMEYRALINNWRNILPTGSKGLQLGT